MNAARWGLGFLRHGDHHQAKKYFTEALEANPSTPTATPRPNGAVKISGTKLTNERGSHV